ncbi:hypothetical protein EA462_16930 [Natrarchaeobius halalkaliphilus]|uniref:Uncharacterized protein n=1 Tax=Natrarchaeobius halalkaliphilus TaxID=1679091 RepID=A0A3N6NTZ2_9EURY|nr:hypothetical protein [Natrarchaeobius halalkaliphilus]RQG86156.1 hypothetical protein EA462_16930 [Natrarchaeobius halalkaliphilus]
MSVIRQPGMLGRTTRHRVVGLTVALTAATVETLAVGLWFVLVVGSRSTTTALAGLGILFCGSLLRTGVFGVAVSDLNDLLRPHRLAVALSLTAGWVIWLLVAELVGGTQGIAIATVTLVVVLVCQFAFERCVFEQRPSPRPTVESALTAITLAVGGAILLASVWFVDLTLVTPPLSFDVTTIVFRLEAVQLGSLAFGICAFLAHQYRFTRRLEQ